MMTVMMSLPMMTLMAMMITMMLLWTVMMTLMAKWMKLKVGPLHDVGGGRGPTSSGTTVNTDSVQCIAVY